MSTTPSFIDPMELLAVARLPEGPSWVYEVKLDGYRAQARSGFCCSLVRPCGGEKVAAVTARVRRIDTTKDCS